MSLQPWHTDRDLTLEDARQAIAERFPTLDATSLRYLASGWEFDAYLTDDNWVFRFPRRVEASAFFERERRVHDLVLRFLPRPVGIPRVELLGEPTRGFPYRFGAHRFIPGVGADEISHALHPVLARDIALAFNALHAIPLTAVHEHDVAGASYDDLKSAEWFEHGLQVASALRGMDSRVDAAIQWTAAQQLPFAPYTAPLHFIHCDLAADHVLADPTTGALTGIIDWTDAMLGDPALDFVVLVPALGWRFTDLVLGHYVSSVDAAFGERLRLLARVLSVMWLAEAHERGGDVEKHVRWVHNAFER